MDTTKKGTEFWQLIVRLRAIILELEQLQERLKDHYRDGRPQ
jgi:hypothetical protein